MAGRPERRGDGVVALVALRVVRMESSAVVHRRGGPDRPVDAVTVWLEIFWGKEGLGTFQCGPETSHTSLSAVLFHGALRAHQARAAQIRAQVPAPLTD